MREPEVRLRSELIDLTGASLDDVRTSTDLRLRHCLRILLREADNPWLAALRLQSASGQSNC